MKFHLSHCPPNPTLRYADSIVLPEGTTEIISEGGGSTIDVGKWLARKFRVKHTAIPTTAGTGTEVTPFCVLTVSGKKKTFTDDRFIPTSYVLDPRKVVSLPPLQTLASGLDALSQAMEARWSKNNCPKCRRAGELASDLIMSSLLQTLQQPQNETYRGAMLIGAHLSGHAIAHAKTNVCHAISYPLTDWYGISHGLGCGWPLRYFCRKFGYEDVADWLMRLSIPRQEIDRELVADEVMKSEKLAACPMPVTREDIINSLV